MNLIQNRISIDLQNPTEPPVVYAVQGERNVRSVQLSIFCDNVPWQVPEGTLVAVRYGGVTRPGGYYDTLPDGSCAWSYEGNTITIILAPQMMTTGGTLLTQVEMLHEDQILATFSFKLVVTMNPAANISEPETYINWLQWMENQLDVHVQSLLESGTFTGPAGPKGDAAEVTSVAVEYQAAGSANIVPTGDWSSTVPSVPAGQHLWTRTTIVFNDTSPVTFYSVTRMGIDGLGSVVAVCSVSPDGNGNVSLTAKDVGALPNIGGDLTGELKMNGQPISGLNAPTANDQAANMEFVNQQTRKAAPRNLLDNSDFRNPVNQRGKTAYNATGYTIDRWKSNMGSNLTVSVADGAIRLSKSNSGGTFGQYLPVNLLGKTVTEAIRTSEGIFCKSFVVTTSASLVQIGSLQAYFGANMDGDNLLVRIYFNDNSAVDLDLYWAALYEGEYTAETLPEYQPKGYGTELLECQRYYQIQSTNNIPAVDMRPAMRLASPTISSVTGGYSYSADL